MINWLKNPSFSIGETQKIEQTSTELHIQRTDGILLEIIVSAETLEWFVVAKISDEIIWRDWADYYATEDESQTSLRADMNRDVEYFCRTVATVPMRLTVANVKILFGLRTREVRKLEWFVDDQWFEISLLSLLTVPRAISPPEAAT